MVSKSKIILFILAISIFFYGCNDVSTKNKNLENKDEKINLSKKSENKDTKIKTNENITSQTVNKNDSSKKVSSKLLDIDSRDYKNPNSNHVESQGFLYEVSHVDFPSKKVYLLGSIHLLKKDFYPLRKEIYDAYNSSESITLEVLTHTPEALFESISYSNKMKLPNNMDIANLLEDSTYERLINYLNENNHDKTIYMNMKPIFISIMLELYKLKSYGYDEKYGIESHITRKSLHDEKQMYQIETIKEQMDVMNNLSMETQIYILNKIFIQEDNSIDELFNAWSSADSKFIQKAYEDMKNDNLEYFESLLAKRNEKMIQYIVSMLEKDKTTTEMVIVGSLHLFGDMGIIEKLKLKGYKIKKI